MKLYSKVCHKNYNTVVDENGNKQHISSHYESRISRSASFPLKNWKQTKKNENGY